ncbi:MAG: cyclase family protein [Candidatus Pacearchaeota archaeon]|nr:cyclase family protein [Candidatus Pacearchaeota archaeon]
MPMIDLSYGLEDGMFKYPSDPEAIIVQKLATSRELVPAVVNNAIRNSYGHDGAYQTFFKTRYDSGFTRLDIRNHHGTHVDAPAHKIPGGKTIDQYPLEKFENLASLIVLKDTSLLRRPTREIVLDDIKGMLHMHYFESLGALVFYTGFCDEMKRNNGVLKGQAKTEFEKSFPYFSNDAIKYVIDKCPKLNILGIDSFSVDRQGSNSEVHRILFEKDILPLETLVNLGDIDQEIHTFQLVCHTLKIKGGDAAPTRAYVEF